MKQDFGSFKTTIPDSRQADLIKAVTKDVSLLTSTLQMIN